MALASDATIEDVLPSLSKPDVYVAGVFGKLHECRKLHGNAAVRIGITGNGLMPYYRVIYEAEIGKADASDRIFGAFFDNHTPLEWKTSERTNCLWSEAFMTYEQVRDLLGRIRDRKS